MYYDLISPERAPLAFQKARGLALDIAPAITGHIHIARDCANEGEISMTAGYFGSISIKDDELTFKINRRHCGQTQPSVSEEEFFRCLRQHVAAGRKLVDDQ